METLRLYEPLEFQDAYHACVAKECLLMKGNRAGGEQPITSKVLTSTGFTTMGDVSVGDTVLGGDGVPCSVQEVIEYGCSPVYRLTFSDGTSCEAGENHKWTCRTGGRARRPKAPSVNAEGWEISTTREIVEYVERHGYREGLGRGRSHYRVCFPVTVAQFSQQQVPLDPYLLGVLIGDGNFTHGHVTITSEDNEIIESLVLPKTCQIAEITNKSTASLTRYGKSKLYSITGTGYRTNFVRDGLKILGLNGKRGYEKFIPESYLHNSIEVRLGLLQGLLDTDGRCGKSGFAVLYTTSSRLAEDVTSLVRSLGGRVSVRWRENSHRGIPGRPIAHITITIPEFNPFRLSRKSIRREVQQKKYRNFRYLEKIEYIGIKPCRCINVDNESRTYLTDDFVVTHNSVAGFVEDARAATGQDPYNKYPKKDGVLICLGYGEGHIGRVIHKYLFRPGAWDIIQDERTKLWRTFRPWGRDDEVAEKTGKPGDLGREKESMPAPPLIPKRFIKGKPAWVKAAHYYFHRYDLINGWVIYAANSNGEMAQWQGFNADLYHIDEDLAKSGWYDEGLSRLLQRDGKMRWTAMPHAKNDDLLMVVERFDQEQMQSRPEGERPTTVTLRASMFDNPYLPKKAVEENLRIFASMGDDVLRRRVYGELTNNSVLVYPTFSPSRHDYKMQHSESCKVLKERGGDPPENWCRYLSIDPGVATLAITYWAVPPNNEHAYLYDEDYILGGDAIKFGAAMAKKCANHKFQAFLIDSHGAGLTDLGMGISPRMHFSRQLQNRDIRSVETGFDFQNGSDNIEGREMAMRHALILRDDGSSYLIFNPQTCPNFAREMQRFKRKFIDKGSVRLISDQSDRRFNTHAIDTAEYLIASSPKYHKPPPSVVKKTWVEIQLENDKARRARYRVINGYESEGKHITLGPRGA